MSKSSYMGLFLDALPRPGRELSRDQGVAFARCRYGTPLLNVICPMPPLPGGPWAPCPEKMWREVS